MDIKIKNFNNFKDYPDQYLIKLGKVDGIQIIIILNNQSIFYSIIKLDIFNELKENSTFSFNNKYSVNVFYGIMPDTKATGVSIVGKPQV